MENFSEEKCAFKNHKNTTNPPQKHHKKPSGNIHFSQKSPVKTPIHHPKKYGLEKRWWRRRESNQKRLFRMSNLQILRRSNKPPSPHIPGL
jgi:hypothetical protein